jgi:adenosylcobyric acid synthase
MRARAVMVLGTSSHVGKSLLTTALCRIFARQGYRVAPFKSQNMSLNSAATLDGREIGRAQALQAEAAGVAATVEMNPILIKPSGDMSSQVVVRGKIWGQVTAADYHQRRVEELMPVVKECYETLAASYEVIVLEGAGSPAEINLKKHDIVNMRMAEMADARCLLVGDIDRGGVFASLLGTLELLEPEERKRIGGFAINKFRGDVSLLEPGVVMMEARVERPCLGVVPYLHGLMLEEEDSLGLPPVALAAWPAGDDGARRLRIAVILLPSCSNFTDFDSLRAEDSVCVRFCRSAAEVIGADVVIVPGSKQTVDDLAWMREVGLAAALVEFAQTGLVIGICGGMQMLGEEIADPQGVERMGTVKGLGLLPLRTTMRATKVTRVTRGELAVRVLFGQETTVGRLAGYEIHVGESVYGAEVRPFAMVEAESGVHADGCVSADMQVFGTYLHGVFDEDEFRHAFLAAARGFYGLDGAKGMNDWKRMREESLDRLADEVEGALDMEQIFGWVGLRYVRAIA